MINKYTFITSTILSATVTNAALAQETGGFLEEIIVNATKRAQSIQDVPIAVSAYSSEMLQKAGITDVRELAQISPSLFLSSSTSEVAGAVARIRGIGTTGDNPGLESSVAIFVDGVYRNRTNVGLTELGPLERIEVLRGPQGTLFGRNASAGLINVVTAKPSFETSGYGELSYGNYSFFRAAAGVNGAIVEDKIAARIDAIYNRRDGFIEDSVTNEDLNDRDRYLIRGKVLSEFDGGGSLLLSADFSKRSETCCAATTIVRGPTAGLIEALGGELGSGGTPEGSDPFDRVSASTPGRTFLQDVKEWGISAELNWEFDGFDFVSITAYRDWQASRGQDIDYTSADILYRDVGGQAQVFETFTQEFRVTGTFGIVDWMVGGFYGNEDLSYDDAIRPGEDFEAYANLLATGGASGAIPYGNLSTFLALNGAGALAPLAPSEISLSGVTGVVNDQFRQNSENWSFFTHNIIDVSDLIDVTLGVRYTEERKSLNASFETDNQACTDIVTFLATPVPGGGGATVDQATGGALSALTTLPCLPFFNPFIDGNYSTDRTETEFTGTAAVNLKWTPDFSTYLSYSRGYKAGGFNLDRAALNPANPDADNDLQFEEETVSSFEIGTKYRNPDLDFSVNATMFYAQYENFQLNAFNGTSFVVVNVPGVENYGFELDGMWQPTEALSFNGGVTYAVAKYDEDLPMGPGERFEQPSLATPDPLGGAFFQLPGEQVTNAPKWSVTSSVSYQPEINNELKAIFYVDGRYTSAISTGSDLDLEKVQDGVFIVNGRVGIAAIEDNWRVEFFMRNVFDTDFIQVAFDAPLQGAGTARNTILPNTQTVNAFLAEPRVFGINVRGSF